MAIDWSGNWKLTAAALSCKDLKLDAEDSLFSLEKVNVAGRAYNIVPYEDKMTNAWEGCVLVARNRDTLLRLPWPVPASPTKEQALSAGKYVKMQIQLIGGKEGIARLEGDVLIDEEVKEVVLFMVEQGFPDGSPLLVAYLNDDLTNPDGSAVGGRQ
jgi:hypothetical protein